MNLMNKITNEVILKLMRELKFKRSQEKPTLNMEKNTDIQRIWKRIKKLW